MSFWEKHHSARPWSEQELLRALDLFPDGLFSAYYFDKVGAQITGRPNVGGSLQNELEANNWIQIVHIDINGPNVRWKKTGVRTYEI